MRKTADESNRRQEKVHQLKTRISQLQLEKEQLAENVYHAEQTLREAAGDRQALSSYINAITTLLEKVFKELSFGTS